MQFEKNKERGAEWLQIWPTSEARRRTFSAAAGVLLDHCRIVAGERKKGTAAVRRKGGEHLAEPDRCWFFGNRGPTAQLPGLRNGPAGRIRLSNFLQRREARFLGG